MELAKVRETFEFVLDSWRKAQLLKSTAESYRLSATGGGIRYDKDHVQTSPEDYQALWIIKAADCEAQAVKVLDISDSARAMTYSWMDAWCTDEERYVLTEHYLLGKTFSEIKDGFMELFDYGAKTTMFDIAQRGLKKISEKM